MDIVDNEFCSVEERTTGSEIGLDVALLKTSFQPEHKNEFLPTFHPSDSFY